MAMKKDTERKLRRNTSRLKMTILAIIVLAIGLVLLWVAGEMEVRDQPTAWVALVAQLGGVVVATGLVTLLWEYFAAQALAEETLSRVALGADVEKSGIVQIGSKYLTDAHWEDLFIRCRRLDVVVAYANTWRGQYLTELQKVASDPSAHIRVFLPDVDDSELVGRLATRLGHTTSGVEERIRTALKEFQDLKQPGGARLEIFVHGREPLLTYYRFDSEVVLTLYSHAVSRNPVVPTFAIRGGYLMEYLDYDLQELLKQSRLLGDSGDLQRTPTSGGGQRG